MRDTPPSNPPQRDGVLSNDEAGELYRRLPLGLTRDEVWARLESAGVEFYLAVVLAEEYRREPELKAERERHNSVFPESDPRNKWLGNCFPPEYDYRSLIVSAIDKGDLSSGFDKPEFLALVRRDTSWWNGVTLQCRTAAENKTPQKTRKEYLAELKKRRKMNQTMSQNSMHDIFGIPRDKKNAFSRALQRCIKENPDCRKEKGKDKGKGKGRGHDNVYVLTLVANTVQHYIETYVPE